MTWTADTPLTVGQIREEMANLPDDAQVFVDGNPDRPIVGVIQSQQIPDDALGTWETGDPTVLGLELWLGGDDEFPAPRCSHSTRPAGELTPPACITHVEVPHRDGRPPWCNACGWNRGRLAVAAQKYGDPR